MRNVVHHRVKTLPQYFDASINGTKPFAIRLDDRNYQVGDTITKCEYDGEFTGREASFVIIYVLKDFPTGLQQDYCILGIKSLFDTHRPLMGEAKAVNDYAINDLPW